MSRPGVESAVVVGGSMAGLAATCALASRAERVTLVERRPLPADSTAPSVAPQGSFPHVLLVGGAAALERLSPGYLDDLFDHGAAGPRDGAVTGYLWAAGRVRTTFSDLGTPMPCCTRGLVERRLRARVRSLPNVTVADDTTVRHLDVDGGRVTAVEAVRDGSPVRLASDLVVDASGRNAASTAWLRDAGVAEPAAERVEVGVTYTALSVRRQPDDIDGGLIAVVQNTPQLARIGVALAAEGDRWQVVLGGYFGDAAAPTRDGVLAFAASLPDPVMTRLLENEWLSEPAQFRFPHSRRQHWEKVRGLATGLVVVGDAVASFNPLYGQGMSSAALQAEALGACLDRVGNTHRLPHAVARATAKVVANPWQLATGADYIYPQTKGPRPAGTDRVNGYIARLLAVSSDDEVVSHAFLRVQHLLAPASSLFAPGIVRRVLTPRRRLSPASRVAHAA